MSIVNTCIVMSFCSDDDDFYDRTKKKKPLTGKVGDNEVVETADTLLDKRDAITKEIDDKKETLEKEKNKVTSESTVENEAGDALDAYMSGLSSQLGRGFALLSNRLHNFSLFMSL